MYIQQAHGISQHKDRNSNLQTSSLSELLASEEAQRIREGFVHNRVVHPYCRHCLGSPNRLKAVAKGLASIYLFKWRGFEPSRVKRVALRIGPEAYPGYHRVPEARLETLR